MPSNNNCCVIGCTNNYGKCPPGTKFYAFPREDDIRFPGRRELWKSLTGRQCGKEGASGWSPTKNSRICSQHFIGGKKVDHPYHPAYVPSFFPEMTKNPTRKRVITEREVLHKRRKQAAARIPLGTARSENEYMDLFQEFEFILQDEESPLEESCNKAVQLDLKASDDEPFWLYCDPDGPSRGTMAHIPMINPLDYLVIKTEIPDDETDSYTSMEQESRLPGS